MNDLPLELDRMLAEELLQRLQSLSPHFWTVVAGLPKQLLQGIIDLLAI